MIKQEISMRFNAYLGRWLLGPVGLLLCFIGVFSGCVSTDNTAKADIKKAAKVRLELASNYFKINRFETALDELDRSIELDNSATDAFALRGLVYLTIGKIEQAQESYDRALKLAPESASVNNSYAWFLCQTNREEDSFAYFQKAINDPFYQTPELAFQNMGICLLKLKKTDQAQDSLRKALELNRSLPEALLGMSKVSKEREKWRESNEFYRQYERLVGEPSLESLWYGIRIAYRAGSGAEVRSRGLKLKERFPFSLEYQSFLHREFDF
jgi:type IV pilus assembly protein PilF